MAFSRDGKTVLTVAYLGLEVWDAATGRLIGSNSQASQDSLSAAFSLDGQRILIGGDETSARLWDATTGQPARPAVAASRKSQVDGAQPRRPDRGDIYRQQRGAAVGRRGAPGRPAAHRVLGPRHEPVWPSTKRGR